jgi:large subunit ribosomal protein L16
MLFPKRTKYRKQQKGRIRGKSFKGNSLAFGSFGLQSLSHGRITSNQIESARVAITRELRRKGKVWIRIFPDKPITKKPLETRMGKGKGAPEFWVAVVKPGRIMFEVDGCSYEVAKEAFRLASHKLPVKCRFIAREDILK